jgi:hypothetical protein
LALKKTELRCSQEQRLRATAGTFRFHNPGKQIITENIYSALMILPGTMLSVQDTSIHLSFSENSEVESDVILILCVQNLSRNRRRKVPSTQLVDRTNRAQAHT